MREELIKNTQKDIEEITRFKGITPKKIFLYSGEKWKYEVYNFALNARVKNAQQVTMELMKNPEYRKLGKEVTIAVKRFITAKDEVLSEKEEYIALNDAREFFSKHFNCKVEVYKASEKKYDPLNKSKAANPNKPAIYLE